MAPSDTTPPELDAGTHVAPRGSAGDQSAPPSIEVDRALLRRCREGDGRAWNELVERYERLVYSVPRRLGLRHELCDETFQDVWAVLLRRLPTLRNDAALPQWLLTTARRIALRLAQRERKRSRAQSDLDSSQSKLAEPEHAFEPPPEEGFLVRSEQAHQVVEALDRLEPGCRDLLTALIRSETSSYAQLADELDMPIGSIGPKRARCLKRLLDLLPAALRNDLGWQEA